MAQLTDILSSEKMRTSPEQIKSIMLYQEGSFYRAYEWSAWLCVRYISKFKVTHRRIKSSDQSMAFISFPLTS